MGGRTKEHVFLTGNNKLSKRMAKSVLVTFSDDRSGRKHGLYGSTQKHITDLFSKCPEFGLSRVQAWTFEELKETAFYKEHQAQLDEKDPDTNGRAYKPFVILEALKSLNDGDYLAYTDTSPEMWLSVKDINAERFHMRVLQKLCDENDGILTAFTGWPTSFDGHHNHENFTSVECLDAMDANQYRYCTQHASGMWVLKKSPDVVQFITEWLKWNLDPRCYRLNSETYIKSQKIGHRTDQSISGILINKRRHRLVIGPVKPIPGAPPMHMYNILQFAQIGGIYGFRDSWQPPPTVRFRRIFDPVKNDYPVVQLDASVVDLPEELVVLTSKEEPWPDRFVMA